MMSSLLYFCRDNTHPAWLSSPFWTGGRESSYSPLNPPISWSPRSVGITFTSCSFWRKWWSLCKTRILRPGFVPVSPKHPNQAPQISCIAAGDGGTERHIQRAAELVLSLGTWRGPQRQRFVLQSEMWEDEWGFWRWWALVQHCERDCIITLLCQVQITPNQSFGDFCVTKPIWQVSCQEEGLGDIWLWPN